MRCGKCGAETRAGDVFCQNCGNYVQGSAGSKTIFPQQGGQYGNGQQNFNQNRQGAGQQGGYRTDNICPYCNRPIMPPDSPYCTNCGKPRNARQQYTQNNAQTKKPPVALIAVLSGVAALLLAVFLIVIFDPFGLMKKPDDNSPNGTNVVSAPSPTPIGESDVVVNVPPETIAPATESPTPVPVPDVPVTAAPATPRPATPAPATPVPQSDVANPSYSTYRDSAYGFTCQYPTHFREYNENDSTARYSSKSPDGSVTFIIRAANIGGRSTSELENSFKAQYTGRVDYERVENDYFAVSFIENGIDHYAYFKVENSVMRGFEFHSPVSKENIYGNYIQHIHDTMTF